MTTITPLGNQKRPGCPGLDYSCESGILDYNPPTKRNDHIPFSQNTVVAYLQFQHRSPNHYLNLLSPNGKVKCKIYVFTGYIALGELIIVKIC